MLEIDARQGSGGKPLSPGTTHVPPEDAADEADPLAVRLIFVGGTTWPGAAKHARDADMTDPMAESEPKAPVPVFAAKEPFVESTDCFGNRSTYHERTHLGVGLQKVEEDVAVCAQFCRVWSVHRLQIWADRHDLPERRGDMRLVTKELNLRSQVLR